MAERSPGVWEISASLGVKDERGRYRRLSRTVHGTKTAAQKALRTLIGEIEAVMQLEDLAAARRLHAAAPDLGAIVLECTNLAPHSALIRQELGVPVYDVMSMLNWFHAGLRPRMYS